MTRTIIFNDSFPVAGAMCHAGCASGIKVRTRNALEDWVKDKRLSRAALLNIDSEPGVFGVHNLKIFVEMETEEEGQTFDLESLKKELRTAIAIEPISIPGDKEEQPGSNKTNWLNIIVNLLALIIIITLSLSLPPSLPLTIGLAVFSILTTAFTARTHLINFFKNLYQKKLTSMATPITFGWALSVAHTLYHSIMMPIARSFSMAFMSFAMPVMLIGFINGMDEIKRQVFSKSKKMQLKGIKSLFPEMAEKYSCYELSAEEQAQFTPEMLREERAVLQRRSSLKEGMYILVRRGSCFPVDGILVKGTTTVDASILTGEPRQALYSGVEVAAGAINVGQDVVIRATKDCYDSTINRMVYRANRAPEKTGQLKSRHSKFIYLYSSLIILSIAAALLVPFGLGIFSIPLLLQNLTGILFAVCPCTLAMAHELPDLLSSYQRNKKGIVLRDEQLTSHFDGIDTVVFDKTGTLTTGESDVAFSEGIDKSVWRRIYLLEDKHGAGHPLANAITRFCKSRGYNKNIFSDVKAPCVDEKNRGLSAQVQGVGLQIGNEEYLKEAGIDIPKPLSHEVQRQLAAGLTPIYVAEDGKYKGVIFIQHRIRKGILAALQRLKNEGKRLIMLTGDTEEAALGFNKQYGSLFLEEDIHFKQTPDMKAKYLTDLITSVKNPKKLWFVGDGLNDAACSRVVSEGGGVSCSITSDDKAAFFTDLSLNGSLDYLFEYERLNRFVKKNKRQNQMLMAYSALVFLAFIISFSVAGIAVSPLIPLGVMLSTTLIVLFNSYRASVSVDVALDKKFSLLKFFIASDLSLGMLAGGSTLFMAAILIATLASGGLALPAISFTAGAVAASYSACLLSSAVLLGLFTLFGAAYLMVEKCLARKEKADEPIENKAMEILAKPSVPEPIVESRHTKLYRKSSLDDAPRHSGMVPDPSALTL